MKSVQVSQDFGRIQIIRHEELKCPWFCGWKMYGINEANFKAGTLLLCVRKKSQKIMTEK